MASGTTITDVTTTFLSIPLERPLVTAAFPIPAIDTALVQVRTADGHEGVAWSFAFGRGRVASLVRLIDDLGELAVGADAVATEALWARLSKAVEFAGRRGLAAAAISTIDTACWDITGQAAGLPVHRLLGGFRDRVETYASQGLWLDRGRDDLAAEAQSLVGQGFRAVKMRAGLPDPAEDVARVRAVREAIGPDVALMVDANQAWDLKQTLRMARDLAEFDLFWLEEPMPHGHVDDYAAAAPAIEMPLCTGESNYYADELLALARRRAADYVMPDLMRMGGVTEWMKAARMCEVFGLRVTPHLFMEHSAHLAGAAPNAVWQEYQPWWQPILETPVQVVDGCIALGDEPGFGLRLSASAVAEYRL
ncbi:mandelate racemase/muconate lactonizing enzyme family protein [Jiangella alba]|uniref:L-alanine-DL-glutamate epimerase n=1 Tax=Jiangella alba TaxID=561176 RepID=A0A1H5L3H4_9ACTN|nr:mandelate racemase/muconate lactonizing enzyme family protein [Jiangella alba]SEE71137.1 L-alanine-DL-glutamate epimerase [Jiangella alba]